MEYGQSSLVPFVPHKVIKTADGQTIVCQDLDQDLEQHQVGVVANQGTSRRDYKTEATMTSYGVAASKGIAAAMTGNGIKGENVLVLVPGAQNPKVQLPSMLMGQTSEEEPCFVNSKQYKREITSSAM